jgi:hypothetical protein
MIDTAATNGLNFIIFPYCTSVLNIDMICQPIKQISYLNDVIIEINKLIENFPFKENILQLGLQVTDADDNREDALYESAGRIVKENKMIVEPAYKYINPRLKGGAVDQWLQDHSEYRIVRLRVMYMNPRTCYSIHSDPYPRIHLPIVTNKQCLMVWPKDNFLMHMPADGTSYFTDTTKFHTFMNCSEVPRIHLVGVVLPGHPTVQET